MKKMYFLVLVFFSLNIQAYSNAFNTYAYLYPRSSPKKAFPHTFHFKQARDLGTESSVVKIYPNPTQGNFFIELELEKNTDIDITVFNAIGIIVHSEKIHGFQGTFKSPPIVFEDNPAGVYFVHIKAGPIKSVERLIKIK